MIEYDGLQFAGMGTLVIDVVLTPAWSVTYIHDRSWMPGERSVVHDVSVTWVMHRDRTATIGWRLKIPEEGDTTHAVYLMWAWRWGG